MFHASHVMLQQHNIYGNEYINTTTTVVVLEQGWNFAGGFLVLLLAFHNFFSSPLKQLKYLLFNTVIITNIEFSYIHTYIYVCLSFGILKMFLKIYKYNNNNNSSSKTKQFCIKTLDFFFSFSFPSLLLFLFIGCVLIKKFLIKKNRNFFFRCFFQASK